MSSKRVSALLVTAALAATMTIGLLAAPAQAALRHIDGTVVSKNADNQTFRITTQSGNRVRIRVNAGTVFQRIPGGFKGLHTGMSIEVEAQPTDSGLLAKHVETRGGGGGGGEDDNGGHHGGHNDGPNHT
ncbi:MAG TPA: DUF5666 domain-containing protein [Solirubrobacterales bacterium]|nr:DUF5666 domain-containing protein [Solirubrobacterales bacterium]